MINAIGGMYEELDSRDFKNLFHAGKILFAGNKKLKIYGTLRCASGKRMKKVNCVFFSSEEDAIRLGFRPCGTCMRNQFLQWRSNATIQTQCMMSTPYRNTTLCQTPNPNTPTPNTQYPTPNTQMSKIRVEFKHEHGHF